MIHFWAGCVKLLAVGYLFSYFWTASTAVYFLLRRDVDHTEMDEVFLDADQSEPSPELPIIGKDPAAPRLRNATPEAHPATVRQRGRRWPDGDPGNNSSSGWKPKGACAAIGLSAHRCRPPVSHEQFLRGRLQALADPCAYVAEKRLPQPQIWPGRGILGHAFWS